MKRSILVLLLLNACTAQWPQGSYTDLPSIGNNPTIKAALVDCINQLVPNHAKIYLTETSGTLSVVLPPMLAQDGIEISSDGMPVSYILASTGTASKAPRSEGAFIRVVTPKGTCAQYFSRDTAGEMRVSGPIMVALAQ